MEKILELLKEIRPEFDFENSENFIEDGYLDSFDVVSLVEMLEGTFDIVIDGLDVLPENFQNIESIVAVINKNGGKVE
ncbi:MAG: acyl carrier protein [Ruminococcus flavefaciens]|nr:acyl carrier protein [Ruminococcus flavefaciens]